jgi:hypothetical protein
MFRDNGPLFVASGQCPEMLGHCLQRQANVWRRWRDVCRASPLSRYTGPMFGDNGSMFATPDRCLETLGHCLQRQANVRRPRPLVRSASPRSAYTGALFTAPARCPETLGRCLERQSDVCDAGPVPGDIGRVSRIFFALCPSSGVEPALQSLAQAVRRVRTRGSMAGQISRLAIFRSYRDWRLSQN